MGLNMDGKPRFRQDGLRCRDLARPSSTQLQLLKALQSEILLIQKHLIAEAERERDEFSKELQELKLSGKIGVDAQQLPRSPAKGPAKTGHADSQPGD